MQPDVNGDERPIAYASQKLSPTQCRWSTIEREAYAVIYALNKWNDIIFGSHLIVFCDHNPLAYIIDSAPKSAKLTRWALALQQQHSLEIKFKKGCLNVVADCLSRM